MARLQHEAVSLHSTHEESISAQAILGHANELHSTKQHCGEVHMAMHTLVWQRDCASSLASRGRCGDTALPQAWCPRAPTSHASTTRNTESMCKPFTGGASCDSALLRTVNQHARERQCASRPCTRTHARDGQRSFRVRHTRNRTQCTNVAATPLDSGPREDEDRRGWKARQLRSQGRRPCKARGTSGAHESKINTN